MERKYCTNCEHYERVSGIRQFYLNIGFRDICWEYTKGSPEWSPTGKYTKLDIANVFNYNAEGDCKGYKPTFWRRIKAFFKREEP